MHELITSNNLFVFMSAKVRKQIKKIDEVVKIYNFAESVKIDMHWIFNIIELMIKRRNKLKVNVF